MVSNKTFSPSPRRVDTNPTRIINRVPNHPLIVSPQSLPITVARYYTDVDGAIIDKSAAPVAMQVDWPVYVLGAYDKNGGYKIARNMKPAVAGSGYFLFSFIVGQGLPFPYATGLNTINAVLQPGDVVQVWTDSVDTPSYFVYIVQNIRAATAGYGSILTATINARKPMFAESLDFYASASGAAYDLQFNEALRFISFNDAGTFRQDDIQPLAFKDSFQYQQGFIRIPLKFSITEQIGFAFYMKYGCDSITFNLNVK